MNRFMERFAVTTPLGNGYYPNILTTWKMDEDGMGYTGEISVWKDGNTKGPEFSADIRICNPIGEITASVDPVTYGCWSSTSFPGVDLTARDFQWLGAWAAEAIKRHRKFIEWEEKMRFETWWAEVKSVLCTEYKYTADSVATLDANAWKESYYDQGMAPQAAITEEIRAA